VVHQQLTQRPLIRRKLAVADGTGVDHRENLTGLHQHTLGVPQRFGVAFSGALVKAIQRARRAGRLSQTSYESPVGRAR
jgi:hypothetical protein